MRIHRLEVQAFGPFAGRETIDFDQLSEQGLFLLNGATGAGKTSVLDAICFALYGSVPGVRNDGRRLRSDHAAPDTAPEVLCEFSARGRRLQVIRNPAWERPKKRGNGTTATPARVLLRERVNGSWQQKSERNDEAGGEIEALLGMNREQFTKVVLLPQGDFAAFLRAKADERQKLLQQLFGSERYERMQEQLAADAATARAAVAEVKQRLASIMAMAEHEAGDFLADQAEAAADQAEAADVPDRMEPVAAWSPEDDAQAARLRLAWLRERFAAETAGAAAEMESTRRRRVELADNAAALEAAAARHAKRLTAEARRQAVEAGAEEQSLRLEVLRRHRAAEVLAGRIEAVDAAAQELEAAAALLREAERNVAAHGIDTASVTDGELEKRRAALSEEAAVVESTMPQEQRYEALVAEARRLQASAADSAAAAAGHQQKAAELAASITDLESRCVALRALADDLEARGAAASAAQELLRVIMRFGEVARTARTCEDEYRRAKEAVLDAKATWLKLLQQRLEQAAGELAERLQDGEACPVCGSCEHPSPSPLRGQGRAAVDAEDEARLAFEAAEEKARAAEAANAAAARELAVLEAKGGSGDPDEAAAEAVAAQARVEEAEAAEHELRGLEDRTAADRLRLTRIREAEEACRNAGVEDTARAEAAGRAADELRERLEQARAGYRDLAEHAAVLRRKAEVITGCIAARQRVRAAEAASDKASLALDKALPASAFTTVEEARAALLGSAAAADLQRLIDAYDGERTRMEVALEDEEVRRAADEHRRGLPVPDAVELEAAASAAQEAADACEDAALRHGLLRSAEDRMHDDAAAFEDAAREAEPLIQRAALLTSLAETARGGRDNLRNMSLSTYVLAARLEEVAIAASVRLSAMSDGRYTLTHDDSKRGNAKSGLGLKVIDEWTGQERDTATLSGGESFMASLALALGLADVVQHEAGGIDIETLFVDEGFGSLDEQALEQVMDALEGLRDGGRVVGLVSHVAEMKLRISSQLHVVKGRRGSSLEISRGDLASV